jgi:hypothetical protein
MLTEANCVRDPLAYVFFGRLFSGHHLILQIGFGLARLLRRNPAAPFVDMAAAHSAASPIRIDSLSRRQSVEISSDGGKLTSNMAGWTMGK